MKKERTYEEIASLYVGTFRTELGSRCLEHLEEVFIDRPMYKKGMSLDEVSYRQGQADLVKQLLKEVK